MVDLDGHDLLPEAEITFEEEDEWWVVRHPASGIASQGQTREEAHEMITEAVLLTRREIGDPVDEETDPDAVLEAMEDGASIR